MDALARTLAGWHGETLSPQAGNVSEPHNINVGDPIVSIIHETARAAVRKPPDTKTFIYQAQQVILAHYGFYSAGFEDMDETTQFNRHALLDRATRNMAYFAFNAVWSEQVAYDVATHLEAGGSLLDNLPIDPPGAEAPHYVVEALPRVDDTVAYFVPPLYDEYDVWMRANRGWWMRAWDTIERRTWLEEGYHFAPIVSAFFDEAERSCGDLATYHTIRAHGQNYTEEQLAAVRAEHDPEGLLSISFPMTLKHAMQLLTLNRYRIENQRTVANPLTPHAIAAGTFADLDMLRGFSTTTQKVFQALMINQTTKTIGTAAHPSDDELFARVAQLFLETTPADGDTDCRINHRSFAGRGWGDGRMCAAQGTFEAADLLKGHCYGGGIVKLARHCQQRFGALPATFNNDIFSPVTVQFAIGDLIAQETLFTRTISRGGPRPRFDRSLLYAAPATRPKPAR